MKARNFLLVGLLVGFAFSGSVWAEGERIDSEYGPTGADVYAGDRPNLYYAKDACAVYLRNRDNSGVVAHLQPQEPTLVERITRLFNPEPVIQTHTNEISGEVKVPNFTQDGDEFMRELIKSYRPNYFLRVKNSGLEAARHAEDFPASQQVQEKQLDNMQESMIAEAGIFKNSLYTVHSTYFIRANDHTGKMTAGMIKEALMDGKSVTIRMDSFGTSHVGTGIKHLEAVVQWYNDNKERLPKMRDPFDPSKRGTVTPEFNLVAFGRTINPGAAVGNLGRAIPNTLNGSLPWNTVARLLNWSTNQLAAIVRLEKLGAKLQLPLFTPWFDYNNISPAHNSHDKYTIGDLAFPELVTVLQRTGNDEDMYREDPRHVDPQGDIITHYDFGVITKNLPGASQRPKEQDIGFQLRRVENWLNSSGGNKALKQSLTDKLLDRFGPNSQTLRANDGRDDGANGGNYSQASEYVLHPEYREEILAIDREYYDHMKLYSQGIATVAGNSGMTNPHEPGFYDNYLNTGFKVSTNYDIFSNFANVGRISPLNDMDSEAYRKHRELRRPERNSITQHLIRNVEEEEIGIMDFTPYPRFHPKYIAEVRKKLALNPDFFWVIVGDHLLTNDMWMVQVYFTDVIWPRIIKPYGETAEEKAILKEAGIEGPIDVAKRVTWYKYGRYDRDNRINPNAGQTMGLNHAKAQVAFSLLRTVITSSNRDQLSLNRNSEIASSRDSQEFLEEFVTRAQRDLINNSVVHGSEEDEQIMEFIRSLPKAECREKFGRARCMMANPRTRARVLPILKLMRGVL